MERILTNPTDIVGKFNNIIVTVIALFFIILACCVAGLLYYQKVALRNAITSSPNFRTLHHGDKPTGGGITFSTIFVCAAFFFWLTKHISDEIFFILGVGGFFATFLGFLDDLYNITAIKKLHTRLTSRLSRK